MKSNVSILMVVLALCVILSKVHGTLSPSSKSKKGSKTTSKEKEFKVKVGPQQLSVFDRNLIEDEPSARDILVESGSYYKDTENRLFNGTVLGYVTSWNNHGYDVAKIWGTKFDIISPVWLQIVRLPSGEYQINGEHDVDSGWIKDVRTAGHHKNKIIPRVLFDKFTDKDFSRLLTYEEQKAAVASLILKTCQKHGFNGIVLEIWSQLAVRVEDKHLIDFVTQIAKTLRSHSMETVLVIPPFRKEMYDLFSKQHFDALYPVISWFSLMTYDFSSIQRPGANAPLHWMRNAVEHICPDSSTNLSAKRSKILLGLNLYGNDFTPDGGSAIIGHEYLSFLKYVKGRLSHDETNAENFFEVKTPTGRHIVFYPTLYSVYERIQLARELGTGISLWELGQGLDYFYDLF
ncbi:Chitinase domain-containing protein 1 [Pseudolycoriella hygida]|uniref:Chitinase domain-containing protein 1 n=1 Tax=Pseudolycoriella hygida TaxID=35572 RepID=A0A9Q0S745_9DIPT|nr:Chitinase domain-containing protein 1 [Pseudolycoriella hygida]